MQAHNTADTDHATTITCVSCTVGTPKALVRLMFYTQRSVILQGISHVLQPPLNTVKLGYSNIGFCDTLSIASNIQWYELISHKATVVIPCLVRHAQMHQPRM
jgi:hypothetical protein